MKPRPEPEPDTPDKKESPGPPERVGPYRIESKLGSGGMGAVYRAWDERLERWVAIKHILPDVAEDPKVRQRLRREARAVASLNHPAIVQIYDIVEMEEGDWIVMELVEGKSLRRLVKEGDLHWAPAAHIAHTVAQGLHEAHVKGLVHRDLKTENVMVTATGAAKILDFGLAKRLVQGPQDTALSVQGAILGTGRAMSPEQAKGDPVDHRSDLFSLGILLYESVTGKAPFLGQSIVHTLAQVCTERQKPAYELNPEIPQELSELIDRLLEKHPDRRPQDAVEVAQALGEIVGLTSTETDLSSFTRAPLDSSRAGSVLSQLGTASGRRPFSVPPTASQLPSAFPAGPDDSTKTRVVFPPSSSPSGRSGSTGSSTQVSSQRSPSGWVSSYGGSSSQLRPTVSGITIKTLLAVEAIDTHRLPERTGETRAYEIGSRHDRLVRDLLAQFQAVEIQKTESFLLLFERPVEAVRYALAYHDHLAGLAQEIGVELKGRVAIHLGEVLLHENLQDDVERGARPLEVEGLAKLVTARVASLAGGGQTLLTQAAYDMSHRALVDESLTGDEFRWQSHGLFELDNVEEKVPVHEVSPVGIAPLPAPADSGCARRVSEDASWSSVVTDPGRGGLRWIAAAAVLLLAAVLASWILRPRPRPGVDASRTTVAILSIRNLTGRGEDGWYSTALSEMLSIELAAGGQLRLIPGESVARLKQDGFTFDTNTLARDTLEKVGKRLDAEYVILGSYALLGDDGERILQLLLQLQDTTSGEEQASVSKTGQEERFFDLVSEAGTELRASLDVGKKTLAEATALRNALPSTTEATRLYAKGLETFRTYDALAARERLLEAVEIDPYYALAHAALSEAWSALGYDREAADSARRAWELSSDLPREERLWIEGLFHATSADWAQAIHTFTALRRFYPESIEYGLRLAQAQGKAGLNQDAIDTLEDMRTALGSEDPRIDLEEAALATALSDYDAALAASSRAIEKAVARESATLEAASQLAQAGTYYYLGRGREAEEAALRAERLFAQVGDQGMLARARYQIALSIHGRGDLDEAERGYYEALEIHEKSGNRSQQAQVLHMLGYVFYERGDLTEADRKVDEAIAISDELGDRHGVYNYRDTKIVFAVQRNDLAAAEELARSEIAFGEEIGNVEWQAWGYDHLGRIAFARGELDAVRERYEKMEALSQDVGRGRLMAALRRGQGEVLLAQGELDAAEQSIQASIRILAGMGDRESEVDAQVTRIHLLFALGRRRECAEEARRLTDELRAEGRRDAMLAAATTLIDALLSEGELDAAREVLATIEEAIDRSENPAVRLAARVRRARFLAADEDYARALREIESTVSEVRAAGLRGVELEARLALGEIEVLGGGSSSVGDAGRRRLDELAEEARTLGFHQIAHRAAEIRQGL